MSRLKKVLSLILAAAIVVSMGVFVLPAVKTSAEAAYQDVFFYVPEAVYVNTANTSVVKYYLNSFRSKDTRSWAAPYESVGKLYFYCAGATSVSISCSASTSNLTTTGTNTINDDSFTINSPGGNGTVITWTATYVVDGITKTVTSYTYVYHPNRVPTGAAGECESNDHSHGYDYHGTVTALWGAQRFDTCSTVGNQQAKSPSARMLLDNSGSMVTGSNSRPHNCGYFDGGYGNTFHYHDNDNVNITVESPYCYFYVDTSRSGNINQIPNFSYGFACTDDQRTEYHEHEIYLQTSDGSQLQYARYYKGTTEEVVYQQGANPFNWTINVGAGSSSNFRIYTYGRSKCSKGGTVTKQYFYIYFQIHNNYKANLRNLYLGELYKSYHRQSGNYTSATWNTYASAMRNAATILGNPYVAYSSVTSAITTLNNAINGLKTTVSFNASANGGTTSSTTKEIQIGGAFSYDLNVSGDSASKTGHSFNGWSTDKNATSGSKSSVTVGFNQTLYAIFTPNDYSLSYDSNGGVLTNANSANVTFDTVFTIPSDITGEREHYTFAGFLFSGDSKNYFIGNSLPQWKWDSAQTLTAQWTPLNYTVTVNKETGVASVLGDGAHPYGENVTVSATLETGYKFDGWYNGNNLLSTDLSYSFEMKGDITLTARASLKEYTVTFKSDGAVIKTEKVKHGYGASAPAENPTKLSDSDYHYIFSNWDKDFSSVESDLTVEAVFSAEGHYGGEATCMELAKCEKCGLSYGEIDSDNHDWQGTWHEPTCTEGAYTSYVCSRNSEHTKIVDDEGNPALDHDYIIEISIDEYPTCTEAGLKTMGCKRCDATTQVVIPALGHDLQEIMRVEPTCTEEGNILYYTCSRCDKIFADSKAENEITMADTVIPANGHELGEWQVLIYPTCMSGGTDVRYCKHCDYYETKDTLPDADAHNFSSWHTDHNAQSHTRVCEYNSEHTETVLCTWDEGRIITYPTCVTEGTIAYFCEVCGGEKREFIPVDTENGHQYINENCEEAPLCILCKNHYGEAGTHDVVIDEAVPATCRSTGLTQGSHCRVCGVFIERQKITPWIDHVECEIPAFEPTCTKAGKTAGVACEVCGLVLKEPEVIPSLGHSYGDWFVVVPGAENIPATLGRNCTRCGAYEEKLDTDDMGIGNRTVSFAVAENLSFVMQWKNGTTKTINKATELSWYTNKDIVFTVKTASSYTDSFLIRADGKEIKPDENGVYTVPAGTDFMLISAEPLFEIKDGEETVKISFWQKILDFIKQIAKFFNSLFKR